MALLFQGPVRVGKTIVLGLLLGVVGGYLMGAMVMEVIDTLSSLRSTSMTPLECCAGLESLSGVTACVAASGLSVAMLATLITAVMAEEVVVTFLKHRDRPGGRDGVAAMALMLLLGLAGTGAFMGILVERIVAGMGLGRLLSTQMVFAAVLSLLLWRMHSVLPSADDLFMFPWMLFYLPAAGMCASLCGSAVRDGYETALLFFFFFLGMFLLLSGLGQASMPAVVLLASVLIFWTVLEEDGEVLSALRVEEATRTDSLFLRAVFLAVLAVLLCEMAVCSSLMSFVSVTHNRKASGCATAAGGLLLLATRRCSRVLGVGGTLGALLGVAGAVSVALSTAGEVEEREGSGDAGRLAQESSALSNGAAIVGAASGAFLSTAPPDAHFGVFMALCTAASTGVLSSFRSTLKSAAVTDRSNRTTCCYNEV